MCWTCRISFVSIYTTSVCEIIQQHACLQFCVCVGVYVHVHIWVCLRVHTHAFSLPEAGRGCRIGAHAANTLQVAVWDRPGQLVTVCSPSPASFICYGSGQNAISCEGEAGGMQRTSKAPESYQELEYCQRCVPTRQPQLTLWCTRTLAMTIHTVHSVC